MFIRRPSGFVVVYRPVSDIYGDILPPFVMERMMHCSLLRCNRILVSLLDGPLLKDAHVIDNSSIFFIIGVYPCLIEC